MSEERPRAPSLGVFINITSYAPEDWRSQLADVRDLHNLEHIEVWLEWLPETSGHLNELVEILAGERLVVHSPFIGMSFSTSWQELRCASISRALRASEVAMELGADVFTIHPGVAPYYEKKAAALDRIASSYRYIQERSSSILVALENMPANRGVTSEYVTHIADFHALLQRCPEMKFTLDIGHALQNSDSYHEFLLSYTDAVVNIHLHDGVAGGPAHLRLGAGYLDIKDFLTCCTESGYTGFVSIETLTREDTSTSWYSLHNALCRQNM